VRPGVVPPLRLTVAPLDLLHPFRRNSLKILNRTKHQGCHSCTTRRSPCLFVCLFVCFPPTTVRLGPVTFGLGDSGDPPPQGPHPPPSPRALVLVLAVFVGFFFFFCMCKLLLAGEPLFLYCLPFLFYTSNFACLSTASPLSKVTMETSCPLSPLQLLRSFSEVG